ncbi:MAG TPA: peptide chain release factor N(5)-glutamine methyltransferase [Actinomycetota bacterium]|nr:peptide chain release factor N(5)-glutamine methyltransferase [Actinomycetota bacterium]
MRARPVEVLNRAADYLERHGVEAPRETAEALLMRVLGTDRAEIYTRTAMDMASAKAFGRALCQRCSGTPLQHLTGAQPFRTLRLAVEPGVFVPRPETEVVVEAALDAIAGIDAPLVVDAGTGTGAIALSVAAEHPGAIVHATDLNPAAVALARRNAESHGLAVVVREGDLLEPLPAALRGRVELVVSNPPYVSAAEYADLPPEVRADPREALVGGTEVHRRLAAAARDWLLPGGALVMEIGASQAEEVRSILADTGYAQIEILPDLALRDRVAGARTGS